MSVVAGCLLSGKILLHYFQLESYQFPGYFRTLRRNLMKALLPGFCMALLLTAVFLLSFLFSSGTEASSTYGPISMCSRCVCAARKQRSSEPRT